MSSDRPPSGRAPDALVASAATSDTPGTGGQVPNSTTNNASRASSGTSINGSSSNSSANNTRPAHHENNNNAANTNNTGVGARGGGGARKNSAERSIQHTRMDDESVQQEYEYGNILGEGSFGKVYRAKHRATGDIVAIKEIVKEKAGSSGLKQLDKEVTIFKKVDHKNIIKLKEVLESPKKMYLIMEVCEGGDLAKLLQKRQHLSEADTKQVMFSLAESIKYLHQQGILHRDLKLENILLAEDPGEDGPILIKVTDFGLSTIQTNNSYENMQEQYCGTPSYMAPEMNSTYSYPVDVWAMGVIMYYLLTKYPKDNQLNESISKDGPKFTEPQWENVSKQAKQLLEEILSIRPAYRPSSGELLEHEWFTGKKREYGNVLELMKDFSREQKEAATGNRAGADSADNGAINGGSPSPPGKDTSKNEPRKGSGGKKGSMTETSLKLPTSSHLKPQGKKSSNSVLTPSPRPASKTPASLKESTHSTGNLRGGPTIARTTATKTTKPATSAPGLSNGPTSSRVTQTPKTASTSKIKRNTEKK